MLRTGPIVQNRFDAPVSQFGSQEQDPINVHSVALFLRRSWKICLLGTVIGLALAIATLLASHSYYTAYATLLLEDRNLGPFPDTAPGAGVDTAYADSQVQVLRSNEVIGRVVEERTLIEDQEFGRHARGLRAAVADIVPFIRPLILSSEPDSRQAMLHATIIRVNTALSIQRVGVSNAVEISFTSRDPEKAANIANAVAQAYIDSRLDLKRKARDDAASQLRERLAEARERAFNSDQTSQPNPPASETGEQARERFREIQSTTETYRTLYNNFLQRYTEAVQQLSVPGARIITPAETPIDQSWPSNIMVLALGIIGGAGIGFSYSLIRQLMNQSLGTAADLHKVAGLDPLSEIRRVEKSHWRPVGFGAGFLQQAYAMESDAFNDAVAMAAVRLQATRINSSSTIIGVTGLKEGSGASSISAHLARVFARSGLKTLLIDANWRMLTPETLNADGKDEQLIIEKPASGPLGLGSLDVLMIRGRAPMADLNISQAIVATLPRVQAEYSCIIVDFHSLARTADVAAAVSFLDDVILVADAEQTTPETVWAALRLLPPQKLSIVMNKVAP
jgi:capsular polysaccharide biosynthesis protein